MAIDPEINRDLSGLEGFRVELTGYCYRMLGSPHDAEDAVQEVLLRAWRAHDNYDDTRGSRRTWLYRIATNYCLDVLKSARHRRELAVDMGPAFSAGPDLGDPLSEASWVLPAPDSLVVPFTADPAERVVLRESVRLGFIAALQKLPPRQRAVLILRDVLGYTPGEISDMLKATPASVSSLLQRARAATAAAEAATRPLDPASEVLLQRYCESFETNNVDALVELLHEEGTSSMPPFPWWLSGRQAIEAAWRAADNPCAGSRLIPVRANGTTALAQYRPDEQGSLRPFGLTVLEWCDGRLLSATTFLQQPMTLFTVFSLTDEYRQPDSYTLT